MTGLDKTGVFWTSTDVGDAVAVHLNQVGVGFASSGRRIRTPTGIPT